MALVSVALQAAKTLLNDSAGVTWNDATLMPLLQEAHREMQLELQLNSVAVIMAQSTIITLPANTTVFGVLKPTNMIEPISLKERDPGQKMEDFVDMEQVTFLPTLTPDTALFYWAWQGEDIHVLGATGAREVLIRYRGSLSTPTLATDQIGVIWGENFLAARTACLARESINKPLDYLTKKAESALYKLIQSNVNHDQRPVRRRRYRSNKIGYNFAP